MKIFHFASFARTDRFLLNNFNLHSKKMNLSLIDQWNKYQTKTLYNLLWKLKISKFSSKNECKA